MSSSFFGLETGLRALVASQLSMDVTAHNVANASTPGYSRQRANLATTDPYSFPSQFFQFGQAGQIGTGVTVSSITRARDAFLDMQLRGETTPGAYWDVRAAELSKAQSYFPEPAGSGIGAQMNHFWTAWEDMAADPTNVAARTAVVSAGQQLASSLNAAARGIANSVAGADYQVGTEIDKVNDMATRIATLNRQIQQATAMGNHPNDLMDQRDQLLDSLAKIVPISVNTQDSGLINVSINGYTLVAGDTAFTVAKSIDPSGHISPAWPDGSTVSLGQSGLGALVEMRDATLPGYLSTLNTLTKNVADAVNVAHGAGVDAYGNPGAAFFTYTVGAEASSVAVRAPLAIDPKLLAVADAALQPGNAKTASAIANLRSATLFGADTAATFYGSLVAVVGTETRNASNTAATQQAVVSGLVQRRQSISGVNLDEEASNLVRFQRAYQAAARVITAVDSMLDTLINRTGRVGL